MNTVLETGLVEILVLGSGSLEPEATTLPFNDPNFSNCHPSISADGQVLFFASDEAGACTNQSYIVDGGWV